MINEGEKPLNSNERRIISLVLAVVAILVTFDILSDSREGAEIWHLLAEGLVGLSALAGIFYLMSGSFVLKHRLEREIDEFSKFRHETEAWRTEARKYLDGLSKAIDLQLSKWQLTQAEKEVAFLLLKGLSLKEIADVRKTSEKTARVQSIAIYAKSGLSGRSELSAYFLEDLLAPSQETRPTTQES